MSHQVKVKVRPGRSLEFPPICVHCSQPASDKMSLQKRSGRVTRLIDVPLCSNCYRQLQRQSGEEERLGRLGLLAAAAGGLLVLVIVSVLLPGGFSIALRLLVAMAFGLITAAAVLSYFKRKRKEAALPEKKAVQESVRIASFSWRATIFEFENETFSERFAELNEPKLMEL